MNNNMYQASDGKWYPTAQMPQGWQQQQQQQQQQYSGGGYGQPQYGANPGMSYGQQQPIIVQQQRPSGGGGAAAGAGCCAAMCAALLCFDLGACLF